MLRCFLINNSTHVTAIGALIFFLSIVLLALVLFWTTVLLGASEWFGVFDALLFVIGGSSCTINTRYDNMVLQARYMYCKNYNNLKDFNNLLLH